MSEQKFRKPNENFWGEDGGVRLTEIMRAVIAELRKNPPAGFEMAGKIYLPDHPPPQSIEVVGKDVIEQVGKEFNIEPELILGEGRVKNVAEARHIVCFILYQLGYSFPAIGGLLSDRDHTTIMNSVEKSVAVIQQKHVRIREIIDEILEKHGEHLKN